MTHHLCLYFVSRVTISYGFHELSKIHVRCSHCKSSSRLKKSPKWIKILCFPCLRLDGIFSKRKYPFRDSHLSLDELKVEEGILIVISEVNVPFVRSNGPVLTLIVE